MREIAAWSKSRIEAADGTALTTAAEITWLDAWHPADALSSPAPAPEAEPEPIYDAALAAHLAAGGRQVTPFAERVCPRCDATGTEPCQTASGKVLRRFHVARG